MAASSLATGTLGPVAAAAPRANPVAAALRATLAAKRVHFTATIAVGDARATATGAVELTDGRTTANVRVGASSTEFRRVGRYYYVNAARLGATARPWVSLDGLTQASQMSERSVAALVASISPRRAIQALESATSYSGLGKDSYGAHYRVVVTAPQASFIPLVDAFRATAISGGPAARIDAWIGANGLLTRLAISTTTSSATFALSRFGAATGIAAPPAPLTGGLTSTSGRYLFGAGVRFSNPTTPTPAVTLAPTSALVDGVVQGSLHAASATGRKLRFSLLSSSRGGKLSIGTVPGAAPTGGAQSFTALPYANWLDGAAKGLEWFSVQAREVTRIDTYVTGLTLIGDIAAPVLDILQDTASIRTQLAPVIGATARARINVRVDLLAPGDTPLALTYKVPGYRGTPISANFFPASGLAAGVTAATVLEAPELGKPGSIDPYELLTPATGVVGTRALRASQTLGDVAYNVITWDVRGTFESGGVAQLNNPFYDVVDASAIIDWAAASLPVTVNSGDPAIGAIGGSSGGELALALSALDPRLDAVVPSNAWNSLITSLQPHGVVDTAGTRLMLSALTDPRVRLNAQIRQALEGGAKAGRFSESALTLLADKNVGPLLGQLQAPSLYIQSTGEAMFPLEESIPSVVTTLDNPYGTPVKMIWMNGKTADPADDAEAASYAKAWFNKYVSGVPIPDSLTPHFQFWDQAQTRYTSDLYPFDPGFNEADPLEGTSTGGTLAIAPTGTRKPSVLGVRVADVVTGQQVVGAPTVSVTYRGTGSARALFARMIDTSTRKALGAAATPVPLVLDGKQHTVSVPLGDIAYTAGASPGLTLRLSSADSAFAQSTSGQVQITAITAYCPLRA